MVNEIKKIVILGSGFAGIYAYLELHKRLKGINNIQITLISDIDYFLFVTLLHEVATGNLLPLSITQSVRSLPFYSHNKFVNGKVIAANFDNKEITINKKVHIEKTTNNKAPVTIKYDYLISAIGSKTNFFGTPGAREHSFTLKTQDDAKAIKNRVIDLFDEANEFTEETKQKEHLCFIIVGGGPSGVEMAGELADYINDEMYTVYPNLKDKARIMLMQSSNRLLPQVHKWFDIKTQKILKNKRHVEVLLNTRITEVTENCARIGGKDILSKLVIWTAGIKAQQFDIAAKNIIEREEHSERIKVNGFLQIENYPEVFVAGDQAWICDNEKGQPYPMRAQFAQREGQIAAKNICNMLENKELEEFKWSDMGFIVSLGKGGALAEIFGMRFSGTFAWWIYRTAYVFKMVGARAKARTIVEWTLNLFLPRDVSRL